MARPGKAAATIDTKTSHRTKAEMEQRKKAESDLMSGTKIIERASVRTNPVAHKEYMRVKNLLKAIGKADDLYGAVCNRYCELFAEVKELTEKKSKLDAMLDELHDAFGALENNGGVDYDKIQAYTKNVTQLLRQTNSIDSLIMQKRKMMFDIEKENCMTVASSIRSIPKTVDKQQENPFIALLCDNDD